MLAYIGPISPSWSRSGKNSRSEEHTSELQSLRHLVCRLLLEKKNSKASESRQGLTGLATPGGERASVYLGWITIHERQKRYAFLIGRQPYRHIVTLDHLAITT